MARQMTKIHSSNSYQDIFMEGSYKQIEGYSLVKEIGRGGMGVVWQAEKNGRTYAIKMCTGTDENSKRRFLREFRLMKTIKSPYVVKAYSYGTLDDGTLYIIEEFAQNSLCKLVRDGLTDNDKFDFCNQICLGLADIHHYKESHRDIKPENVLIVNGVAKITDFGIGRFIDRDTTTLTRTDDALGTYGYNAPELCENGNFRDGSFLIDIYALGCLIFYVFSNGVNPLSFGYKPELAYIYPILIRCRKVNPQDRFQTVEEVKNALIDAKNFKSRYWTLQQVFDDANKLSSTKLTEYMINILLATRGISNLLDNLKILESNWEKLDKVKMKDFANDIANLIVDIFNSDQNYRIQFEDSEPIAKITVLLSPLIEDPDTKVKLLDFSLGLAIGANRWDAIKDLHQNMFSRWDKNTIIPYVNYIKEHRNLFFKYKNIIGVSFPSILDTLLQEN
ncbi:MAG: serine/threonine protein kinase [Prevotella sp.]|nr:serine/threonine-protein kinase [Prevotella sp.]MCH3993813.1 serine/threonine protein kinase [Prevotella sp.]